MLRALTDQADALHFQESRAPALDTDVPRGQPY